MTARGLFDAALNAVYEWRKHLPDAAAFCDWPDDIAWTERPTIQLPASELIRSDPGRVSNASTKLAAALQSLAPYVEWRHSYTADEVGQDFLNRFGWFELAGPQGHFYTNKARITVGYWGPNLFYPRHHHEPEELYTVVSGQALFHADGEPDALLCAGDTRLHLSNQPHAMTTKDHPVLTLVFWRGENLAAPLKMSAA